MREWQEENPPLETLGKGNWETDLEDNEDLAQEPGF